MIPEIGHFALILALLVALAQGVVPMLGAARGDRALMSLAVPAARTQFALVALAFACLAYAFVTSDFSVANVAQNSNSHLPARYRFAATWGSHEGSLLLWSLMLATWGFALLFVVGPVLTLIVGPNAAVVYTAIGAYWTVFMAIFVVWWQRSAFGLTRAQAGWLSLDLVICPAFLPNLVRKITFTRPIDTDGAQLLFATAASDLKEDFVTRLEARTEGLLDGAVSEGPEPGELRSYVDVVRAAQ